MIACDSKSYPYLAIARHYGIPYAEVLKYADSITKFNILKVPYTDWRLEVWCLERDMNNAKD